jgi:hypothetical protein
LWLDLELNGSELKTFATWRRKGNFREAFGPGGGVISVVLCLSIIPWNSAYTEENHGILEFSNVPEDLSVRQHRCENLKGRDS